MLTIVESGSTAWAVAATNGDLHVYVREDAADWLEVAIGEDSEPVDQDAGLILEAAYEQQTQQREPEQGEDEEEPAPEAEEDLDEEEPDEEEPEEEELDEEEPDEEEPEEEELDEEELDEEPEEEQKPKRSRGPSSGKSRQTRTRAKH